MSELNQSKLIKGTFILTAGTVLSKVIGLFYNIPFARMMGKNGQEPYTFAYVIYTVILCVATAGFPSAISKFTAKYNALGEYELSRKMFRVGQIVMAVTGVLAFLVVYAISPWLAHSFRSEQFSIDDMIFVMRSLSFALLIVPSISIFRGYFQGYGDMVPTSVSQVIEQIARVLFLLAGVYYAMRIRNQQLVLANSLATFGAFIGAIFAMVVLLYFWMKKKPELDALLEQDRGQITMTTAQMFREIFISSIPFIIVAVVLPMFQLVDSFTFNRTMAAIGLAAESSHGYVVANLKAQQLVMIPITLATAFQISLIPNIAAAVTQKNYKLFKKHLDDAFSILLLILIPATIGMSFFSQEFFTVFYGHDSLGTSVLRIYAPIIIFFALLTVTAAILQGMNKQFFSVKSLLIGLGVKMALAIPFIRLFHTEGIVLSGGVAYMVIALLNLIMIKKQTQYRYKKVFRRALLALILSLIMVAVLFLVRLGLIQFFDEKTSFGALGILAIGVPVGALLYFLMAYRMGLLSAAFGAKTDALFRKLKFKK